jgi:hypothetical protein
MVLINLTSAIIKLHIGINEDVTKGKIHAIVPSFFSKERMEDDEI